MFLPPFYFLFLFFVMCFLSFSLFFFNDTATTEIYTLSLHDALPISLPPSRWRSSSQCRPWSRSMRSVEAARSEEHTSELQSLRHLVCRLLLEKKKKYTTMIKHVRKKMRDQA